MIVLGHGRKAREHFRHLQREHGWKTKAYKHPRPCPKHEVPLPEDHEAQVKAFIRANPPKKLPIGSRRKK